MPSSRVERVSAALIKRSMYAFVIGDGGSPSDCMAYLRFVLSMKSISLRRLLTVEMRRSSARYWVSTLLLLVSGRRTLPMSEPMKETIAREMWLF